MLTPKRIYYCTLFILIKCFIPKSSNQNKETRFSKHTFQAPFSVTQKVCVGTYLGRYVLEHLTKTADANWLAQVLVEPKQRQRLEQKLKHCQYCLHPFIFFIHLFNTFYFGSSLLQGLRDYGETLDIKQSVNGPAFLVSFCFCVCPNFYSLLFCLLSCLSTPLFLPFFFCFSSLFLFVSS